ncbi:MAG: DNA polymerase III subunit delta [Deltaproteobacteria bacterium]|nr:DNA polymerase III subunit delta [Deltaproteobacteria bacterium]
MAADMLPEAVLKSLEKGRLDPFYLFYGPGEFRLEKVMEKIREVFIPESARDLNLEIFYGDKKTNPAEIISHALSLPFMAQNRLIIVRRTEGFNLDQLEYFLPYFEKPSESTCLIFIASKTDFRKNFFKRIKFLGRAVNFLELKERQVVPWIKRTAEELGLKIDNQASLYLHQIVGNRLRDLHAELEKLHLSYGEMTIGINQVKELAIHSRIYTIFELMNAVSVKNCAESLGVLNRFLQEEDKRDAPLRIIGMLNRQIRLLWYTKSILAKGGRVQDVAKKLGSARFSAGDFVKQSKHWSVEELERGLNLLYRAEGLLKSDSRPIPVMENLILSLCG